MEKVRTIIWDLDDTVWLYKKEQAIILCEKLNILHQATFEKEYYNALANLSFRFIDEIVTYDKVRDFIYEQMPILRLYHIDIDKFLKMLCAEKQDVAIINQEAIEMMSFFKQKNLKNISITDWFEEEQKKALSSFGVRYYIEKIYGCDNSYFKSSIKKVFEIKEKLQLEGKESEYIIIGDSLTSDIFFVDIIFSHYFRINYVFLVYI